MQIGNLISLLGLFVLPALTWAVFSRRAPVNWRLLGWGIGLQALFAWFIFQVPAGVQVFLWVNDAVVRVLGAASAGSQFVFGTLAIPPGGKGPGGEASLGFILAFQAFPTIVFFSALMAVLYHLRIMPLLVRGFALVFTKLMRVSGAESLSAASNIFVGVESTLTIKPFLETMTRSELCVVLTAGMATVASNVLALYVFCLQKQFPNIAGHLVSASVLSAPAALIMAKLVVPEKEQPRTLGRAVQPYWEADSSLFEAIIRGANDGLKLVLGIVALLLAVLGLVALADLALVWCGGHFNVWFGWHIDWSLRALLGWLFYPFALLTGVHPEDARLVGRIVGERVVATEVAGYQDLAAALAQGLVKHPRSAIIATYSLCGFAHLAAVAIFVGGTAALAPSRTKDLAALGLRALIAATLACLMTGCAAGAFAGDSASILGIV